jgi:hypothetical protein
MDDRKTFLISMYNQLCNEMDRHIKITWQIVGVLLSTFTVFALVQNELIPLDLATDIVIVVACLALGIIIESNFWYNRNLVMVANIERQFLEPNDASEIHYYFIKHRDKNAFIDMMKIQMIFVLLILIIVVGYHYNEVVLPSLNPENDWDFLKISPYLILVTSSIILYKFYKKRIVNYNKFKTLSPGKPMLIDEDIPSNSDHKT